MNTNLSSAVASDWTYTYDARNRCVKRVINGVTTYLIYDGWSLLEERNLAGNLLARYYHGPVIDELLCRVTETNTVYYHHDGLGSTVALTDSTGSVVESYNYDVYGQPMFWDSAFSLQPSSLQSNRYLFTGREYLAEIALYDYRHRFYSPSLGRFLQTDPLRFDTEDVNLYRYCENSPTQYRDSFGLTNSPGDFGWDNYHSPSVPQTASKCSVLTTTVDYFGPPFDALIQVAGISHADIAYDDTVVYMGAGGDDVRRGGQTLDGYRRASMNPAKTVLRKKKDGYLAYGSNAKGEPICCKDATDGQIKDCLHARKPEKGRNCHGDVFDALNDCCLEGWASFVAVFFPNMKF